MNKQDIRLKKVFLKLLPTAQPIQAPLTESADVPPKAEKRDERGVGAFWPLVARDPLYHCEDGTEYIDRDGKLLLLDNKNRELVEDLRLAGWDLTGKAPSRETISTSIDLLCALARRDGEEVELFNRCGTKDGKFFYDLGNGKAVEVAPLKWRLVKTPVMFRRMRHQKEQLAPVKKVISGAFWTSATYRTISSFSFWLPSLPALSPVLPIRLSMSVVARGPVKVFLPGCGRACLIHQV